MVSILILEKKREKNMSNSLRSNLLIFSRSNTMPCAAQIFAARQALNPLCCSQSAPFSSILASARSPLLSRPPRQLPPHPSANRISSRSSGSQRWRWHRRHRAEEAEAEA
uniref:Uncharacterized protein n=1 Tax=Zea mays TaxID=4577 RepID=A0A804MBG7_MAIZE